MAALTKDRNTPRIPGDLRHDGIAANVTIYAGAIAMRDATGFITKGQTALGLVGVGRAEDRAIGGAVAGDARASYRPGVFLFANSGGADLIARSEIGKPFFVVDDQTVAKTNGGGTRSLGGFVHDVDGGGVWCRFDEVLAQSYLAGTTLPL